MAWVRGIKEARIVQPEREGRSAIPDPVRVVVDLPANCVAAMVRRSPLIFLPVHTGAGPCGTYARRPSCSVFAWSVKHLIEPLSGWYAEQARLRASKNWRGGTYGPKHGGGNGQSTYA